MKDLVFPEIKKLSDLFSSVKVYDTLKECQDNSDTIYLTPKDRGFEEIEPLSNAVMMDHKNGKGYKNFTIEFNSEVLPRFITKLENGVNLSGYIEFIQRDDLTTLVVLKFNRIIGGFWIALIPSEGMPESLKPIPFKNVAKDPYITHVHRIQHGVSLDRLVDLIAKYKIEYMDLDYLNSWDGSSMIELHGNFDRFSLNFSIGTNDPKLVEQVAYNMASCKNEHDIDFKNIKG